MHTLFVTVIGTPVAQGSKVANRHAPGVRDSNAKTLKPWRAEVAGCVAEEMSATGWTTLDAPAQVLLTFLHERPASHYGTGRNAGVLKPSAPCWKATAPDVDKLARAILDALTTSRALRDDARVARLVVEDLWADAGTPTGVRIAITPLTAVAAAVPSPVHETAATVQEALL